MRNIKDRKNDIPGVFTGINEEINKNKIIMHLAERNLGKNIKGEEWDTLSKFDRSNRISEVEIIDNPYRKIKKELIILKEYENDHHKKLILMQSYKEGPRNQGLNFLTMFLKSCQNFYSINISLM